MGVGVGVVEDEGVEEGDSGKEGRGGREGGREGEAIKQQFYTHC